MPVVLGNGSDRVQRTRALCMHAFRGDIERSLYKCFNFFRRCGDCHQPAAECGSPYRLPWIENDVSAARRRPAGPRCHVRRSLSSLKLGRNVGTGSFVACSSTTGSRLLRCVTSSRALLTLSRCRCLSSPLEQRKRSVVNQNRRIQRQMKAPCSSGAATRASRLAARDVALAQNVDGRFLWVSSSLSFPAAIRPCASARANGGPFCFSHPSL